MSNVVSVIVPIYNVEPYLRSCLDSVVAQARNCTLDAILVDDGSTDASASIAEEYVERHPYMRLTRKRNGGLGQARNVGAAEARGDYLVFLDSDDILPDGTYAAMTSALAAAPVDFVTGGVVRLKGQATIVSGAHQKSHPADSSATHIREHRGLLWDTTAWNKMFRRGFWESHHLTFPEGVLYEDMELMTRSHLLAKQVAVLKRTSYLWRIRTEWPPSITQCRTDLQNLDDRFTAIFALFDTLQQRGTPELLEAYEHKILSMDMPIYVRHYGKNDTQQYRDRLERYVRKALQQCATGAIDRTTSVDRLKYWLIAHDRAAEVAGINMCQDTHFDTCPLNVHEGRVLRAYPTLDVDRGALPSPLVDVTSELSPHTTVYDITRDGRDLRMDVHAFVPGLSPETSRAMVRRFSLRNAKSGRRIELDATPWSTRVPTAMLQILHFDGAWSRVTLRLPVDAFLDQAGDEALSAWDVWVECELAGLTWSDRVRRRDGEFMDRDRFVETRGGRVRACLSGDDRLQVVLESVVAHTTCTAAPEDADAFDIALSGDPDGIEPTLVLRGDHGPVCEWSLGLAGPNGAWTVRGARVVAAMAEAGLTRGRLTVRSGTRDYGVAAFRGFEREWRADDGRVVTASGNADGYLTVVRWPGGRRITDLSLDPAGVLRVLLEAPPQTNAADDDCLEMVHQEKGCRVTLRPACGDDHARHEVDLAHIDRWSVDTPVPPGEWRIVVRPGRTGQAEYEPAVVGRLREVLPLDCRSNGVRASLRVNDAGSLVLRVMTDWPEEADLLAKRRRLETDLYPVLRRRPLTSSVVFESWAGSAFGDGPRQVYDELTRRVPHARMMWVTSDPSAMIPKGPA